MYKRACSRMCTGRCYVRTSIYKVITSECEQLPTTTECYRVPADSIIPALANICNLVISFSPAANAKFAQLPSYLQSPPAEVVRRSVRDRRAYLSHKVDVADLGALREHNRFAGTGCFLIH